MKSLNTSKLCCENGARVTVLSVMARVVCAMLNSDISCAGISHMFVPLLAEWNLKSFVYITHKISFWVAIVVALNPPVQSSNATIMDQLELFITTVLTPLLVCGFEIYVWLHYGNKLWTDPCKIFVALL